MPLTNFIILITFNLIVYWIIIKYRYRISEKLRILDIPNIARKKHSKPMPLIGGIQILFFLTIFFLADYFLKNLIIFDSSIYLICLFVFIIGFIDDRSHLSGYIKLGSLYLILLLCLFFSETLNLDKLYFEKFSKLFNLGYFNIFLTAFFIVALINAYNLCDGINGLALIIGIIWITYLNFFLYEINNLFIIFFIILLIVTIYFNLKNYFYLGDSGSMLLPAFIGLITIHEYNKNLNDLTFIPVEKIFILFMIPGLDMCRVFYIRLINKKDPFKGDRDHLHYYLIDKYNNITTLLIYSLLMIVPLIVVELTEISLIKIILVYSIFFFLICGYLRNISKSKNL